MIAVIWPWSDSQCYRLLNITSWKWKSSSQVIYLPLCLKPDLLISAPATRKRLNVTATATSELLLYKPWGFRCGKTFFWCCLSSWWAEDTLLYHTQLKMGVTQILHSFPAWLIMSYFWKCHPWDLSWSTDRHA